MIYNHEANIRGEGKTVHVVFTSLSIRLLLERGGGGRSKASPPNYHQNHRFSLLIRGYFFKGTVS
jgi:hypothetical protein